MTKTQNQDCRCAKTACGCSTKAATESCPCGSSCACAPKCNCGAGCGCSTAK